MLNVTIKVLQVVAFLLIIFAIGFFIGSHDCDELDANCDGQLNLTDVSIYLWRADQIKL